MIQTHSEMLCTTKMNEIDLNVLSKDFESLSQTLLLGELTLNQRFMIY